MRRVTTFRRTKLVGARSKNIIYFLLDGNLARCELANGGQLVSKDLSNCKQITVAANLCEALVRLRAKMGERGSHVYIFSPRCK